MRLERKHCKTLWEIMSTAFYKNRGVVIQSMKNKMSKTDAGMDGWMLGGRISRFNILMID